MDGSSSNTESLIARIQQLEHERDELHKDIEQLCMQQAGPSYLAVATRMHFQRTAGLEQEIESLKKKFVACTRENLNLQEELSEAYHIKSQLADLHVAEVAKNMEVEKQVKFFQGCVAAAFAERDHSLMEAEKAKEKEGLMSRKLSDFQKRFEDLTADWNKLKEQNAALQFDLAKQEVQNENFKRVIDKFYEMRQPSSEGFEVLSWDDKCKWLLHDDGDLWSFNDHKEVSTSKYISALEEELETLRSAMDDLQYKLRVGLEIENQLRKRVSEMEQKKFRLEESIKNGISGLLHHQSQNKAHVMKLLDEGKLHLKSIIDMVEEKIGQLNASKEKIGQLNASKEQNLELPQRDIKPDENECRDVHISNEAEPNLLTERNDTVIPFVEADQMRNGTEALALAMQEKVSALLLLSQQEERHLLERNVNAALQKKLEELQRNLLQVTNEKVKALMELAQLRLEYQILLEKTDHEIKQGNFSAALADKNIITHERDGKLKGLLKKTYLKHWVGTLDYSGYSGNEIEAHQKNEGTRENIPHRRSNYSMDFARMKIENATLKESMECMQHLTSSVHKLRLSLLKAKELLTSEGTASSLSEALEDIISEAKLVKTALGSSLPVSWSTEASDGSLVEGKVDKPGDTCGESSCEKIDSVSAAGFEMVELLILAAEILKGNARGSVDAEAD